METVKKQKTERKPDRFLNMELPYKGGIIKPIANLGVCYDNDSAVFYDCEVLQPVEGTKAQRIQLRYQILRSITMRKDKVKAFKSKKDLRLNSKKDLRTVGRILLNQARESGDASRVEEVERFLAAAELIEKFAAETHKEEKIA